jgi:hypothetical protein
MPVTLEVLTTLNDKTVQQIREIVREEIADAAKSNVAKSDAAENDRK